MLTRDTFLHKFMLNEKAKKKGYKDTLSNEYWFLVLVCRDARNPRRRVSHICIFMLTVLVYLWDILMIFYYWVFTLKG